MRKFEILYMLLALILHSCQFKGEVDGYNKVFPKTEKLCADSIAFNEIIKLGDIYKTKNYIVLRNMHEQADFFFFVYSYPSMKYLYSFARCGNGAGEYLMPTVVKNMSDDLFAFRDHGMDKFVVFSLSDSTAVLQKEWEINSVDGRFHWEINAMGKDKYLTKRSNSKYACRELWNLERGVCLDTLPNTFNLSDKLGRNYYTEFDDYWLTASDTLFACAYYFIDRLEFGRLDKGRLILNSKAGVSETPDFYLFSEKKKRGKFKYNVDYNIVRYESLYCTPQCVYALYAGVPWGDIDTCHSYRMEVYDWEGNKEKLLELDKSLSNFIVDESTQCIYGINLERYEDKVLVYHF